MRLLALNDLLRAGCHRYSFGDVACFEVYIQRGNHADLDVDGVGNSFLEISSCSRHGVSAGQQSRKGIESITGGGGRFLSACGIAPGGNSSTGYDTAAGIRNGAAKCASSGLGHHWLAKDENDHH